MLVSKKNLPCTESLVEKITKEFPFVKGIVVNINPDRTNNVYGERDKVIYGVPYIYDNIGDIK